MKTAHIVFQLAAASVIVPGQIDHECRTFCTMLAVQDGAVKFIDQTPPGSSLNVGDYVSADQPLIPLTEAPIRDLHSRRGWRVVVSASLDHDELVVRLRLVFFLREVSLPKRVSFFRRSCPLRSALRSVVSVRRNPVEAFGESC